MVSGTVPAEDLPAAAADVDMQDREDSDLSASVLRKISDIVARQVSLALKQQSASPGPGTSDSDSDSDSLFTKFYNKESVSKAVSIQT